MQTKPEVHLGHSAGMQACAREARTAMKPPVAAAICMGCQTASLSAICSAMQVGGEPHIQISANLADFRHADQQQDCAVQGFAVGALSCAGLNRTRRKRNQSNAKAKFELWKPPLSLNIPRFQQVNTLGAHFQAGSPESHGQAAQRCSARLTGAALTC